MKLHISRLGLIFGVLAVLFSGPAFAAKDVIYPSDASATVGVAAWEVTRNFTLGAQGHVTLESAILGGDAVSVSVDWSIQDKSGPGTNTVYPRTVGFSASTTVSPLDPVSASVDPTQCTVNSNTGTCRITVSFYAPGDPGLYELKVVATDLGGTPSNVHIEGESVLVNFTVTDPPATDKLDTRLTVAQQCFLLNAGVKDLTATLEERDTAADDAISGALINFFINPELDGNGFPTGSSFPIGNATTLENGVATLEHDISGLSVGDHVLYAEFDGDANYHGSNDSNTLGITYLFVGFGQPIKADGTSIFGGRVIPIKIRLVDAYGDPVTDATPMVWLQKFDEDLNLGEEWEQTSSVSSADTDNIMRYDPKDQQYIYNWDATGLANGTYAVMVDLGDSATCRTQNPQTIITVDRRGGGKK